MINCIIVDDELHHIKNMREYVEQTPFLHLLQTFDAPLEALPLLNSGKVDLAFLDIHMPGLTGIELMEIIHHQNLCKVIFSTGDPLFAVQGYDNDIVDYLVKPISYPRFLKAARKAEKIIEDNKKDTTAKMSSAPLNYIFVRGAGSGHQFKINLDDIDYIESKDHYVIIYRGTDKHIEQMHLKEMEEKLPRPRFLRIHNSYIVQTDRVTEVKNNEVILDTKKVLPIGKTYRKEFLECLGINK
jgi:two-component system, LytTR family, response regulator